MILVTCIPTAKNETFSERRIGLRNRETKSVKRQGLGTSNRLQTGCQGEITSRPNGLLLNSVKKGNVDRQRFTAHMIGVFRCLTVLSFGRGIGNHLCTWQGSKTLPKSRTNKREKIYEFSEYWNWFSGAKDAWGKSSLNEARETLQ